MNQEQRLWFNPSLAAAMKTASREASQISKSFHLFGVRNLPLYQAQVLLQT